MKWIRQLLGLCQHKWAKVKEVAVWETWDGESIGESAPSYHKYVLQCDHCGDIRVRKI